MKNLTEFSGVILRKAMEVRGTKLTELKAAAKALAETEGADGASTATTDDASAHQTEAADTAAGVESPPDASVEGAASTEDALSTEVPADEASAAAVSATEDPAEASAADEAAPAAEAPADAPVEARAEDEAAPVTEASADAPAEASADASGAEASATTPSETKPGRIDDDTLAEAVGAEMGIEGDKLKYLMGALKAVGRKGLAQVRKVRVFQGEEAPAGAFSVDNLHFVVDRIIVANKAKGDRNQRGKGGKGGKGRGRKEGRSGGAPGGGRPSGQRGGGGFDGMSKDTRPGEVPTGGLGWSLSREPGSEKKEGRGRGKPRRKGPRRGKPGAKPGEERKPNSRNRNRNRKPRTDAGNKPPEVTVKAPMVAPGQGPADAKPPESAEVKPAESPKSEA